MGMTQLLFAPTLTADPLCSGPTRIALAYSIFVRQWLLMRFLPWCSPTARTMEVGRGGTGASRFPLQASPNPTSVVAVARQEWARGPKVLA